MKTIHGALVALLAAGPATARAQDAGMFRIYQGLQEVGREVFSDDGTTLRATVTIPLLTTKIEVEETRAAGRATRAVIRAYALPADTLLRTYEAVVQGDSVRLSLTPVHGAARTWARRGSPDEFGAEQTLSGILRLVHRANRTNDTLAYWLPSADSTLPLTVTFTGDSVEIHLAGQQMFALLGEGGRVQLLEVPSGRVRFVRHPRGDSLPPLPGLNRPAPSYAAPAGAGYTAEQVRVPVRPAAGDSFSLGCTFTRPATGGPRFPAVITLTGSGSQDRDENLWPLVPDYRLFRDIAVRLAAAGIAVLRCDDRGFGESGGEVQAATMVDFAADARAQLAWLRARPDVRADRLAVAGHSEGGIVGPMVAAADSALRALVIMAGTSKTMRAVVRDQFLWPLERATGLSQAQRDAARADAERQATEWVDRPIPYLQQARDYDPLVTARRVHQPVLILQGALDRQVSAGQADTLAAELRAAGNRDVTAHIFPSLNHLFLVSPAGTGATEEYPALRDVTPPAEVLETLARWLAAKLAGGTAR